jgi:hypothetical protein
MRDGWKLVEHARVSRSKDRCIFEKPLPKGWTLRKIAHGEVGAPEGKGCYWDEHELAHVDSGQVIACPEWEWADLDGNRVVWANAGKLWEGRLKKDGLAGESELVDFSEMIFAPIEAPY